MMRLLAAILLLEGHFGEAQQLAHQSLVDQQKAYGSMNRNVASAIQVLGRLALAQGHFDEAEAELKKAIPIFQGLHDVTNVPKTFSYLGDTYRQKRSYNESEQAYRKAIELYPSSLSGGPEQMAQANRKLGEVLLIQGRYAEAEVPFQASYRFVSATPASPAGELVSLRKNLVTVYSAQGTNQATKSFGCASDPMIVFGTCGRAAGSADF